MEPSTAVHDTLTIAAARSYLLRVPVPPLQVDAQSVLEAWDVLVVELETASGLLGWGYQCGFGAAMSALKHFLDGAILPGLVGRDAGRHREWWPELYLLRHHTGLNGPAIQGVSAPEVAAWDLMARAAEVPLWMLLGGRCRERVLCYDTNSGWLGYTLDELVENMKRSVDEGFRGVKVKIGSDSFDDDLRRLEAVRGALGDNIMIATDANNRWDLQTALQCAPALADLDVAWLEEPLYPFDVPGHAELAASIETPLLHGENLYDPLMIRDMLEAGALGIVQPSEMKLGGLSCWLEVAALAQAAGKRVVPAGWTMLQIDQHLAAATPHCWMIESIPWIRDIFEQPARFEDGHIVISDEPGASTRIRRQALEEFAVKP